MTAVPTSSNQFEEALKFGRLAETDIVLWLRRKGNSVITCYEIQHDTGKGPRFFAPTTAYVAPDILVFSGSGKVLWCEAKHKTVFSWYRKGGRWVTGIDRRHYRDYQNVASITGLPVWLLFLHSSSVPDWRDAEQCPPTCPTGLYGRDIDFLMQNESHQSDRHGTSGMVYWDEKVLKLLASVEEVNSERS